MDDETYAPYQFCISTFGYTSAGNQELFCQYDSVRRGQGNGLHEAYHAIFDDGKTNGRAAFGSQYHLQYVRPRSRCVFPSLDFLPTKNKEPSWQSNIMEKF